MSPAGADEDEDLADDEDEAEDDGFLSRASRARLAVRTEPTQSLSGGI